MTSDWPEEVGCRTVNWDQRASSSWGRSSSTVPRSACTPKSTTPRVPPATFNKANMIAFDTVYHPENTMFLKLPSERDCKTINGVEMFIGQAAAQFKLYTGQEAPTDLMRDVVSRKLGPIRE